MCGCLLHTLTGDLADNPGMCPDWESNWQAFGSQASAQSTEPQQSGLLPRFLIAEIGEMCEIAEKSGQSMSPIFRIVTVFFEEVFFVILYWFWFLG